MGMCKASALARSFPRLARLKSIRISCRIPNPNRELFPQRGKGCLDLFDPRAAGEIQQPVHLIFGNPDSARELRLFHSGGPQSQIQFGLSCLGWPAAGLSDILGLGICRASAVPCPFGCAAAVDLTDGAIRINELQSAPPARSAVVPPSTPRPARFEY